MPSEWAMRAMHLNAHRQPGSALTLCQIPARVRLEHRVHGDSWADGVATGWVGQIVRVQLDDGVVWLDASDVRRQ